MSEPTLSKQILEGAREAVTMSRLLDERDRLRTQNERLRQRIVQLKDELCSARLTLRAQGLLEDVDAICPANGRIAELEEALREYVDRDNALDRHGGDVDHDFYPRLKRARKLLEEDQ